MEITKEQVIEFLKSNKELISELTTNDHVEKFLNTDEGKKLLQPKLDKYFNKGLETWKERNLDELVKNKVAELYPTESPEMLEIKKLKAELEHEKNMAMKKDLTLKAQTLASEKGLPTSLAAYFVADNEELTHENIESFSKHYQSALDSAVMERTKGSTPKVPTQVQAPQADVRHMNFADFAKHIEQQK